MVAIENLANSRQRLKIASFLSSRPSALGELASLTGISVQGVLKHLNKLAEEGILKEQTMVGGKYLRQRKLYSIGKRKVVDYSGDDLLLAALGRAATTLEPEEGAREPYYEKLDWLAQDIIILRRRARDLSHRLKRVLDEVIEDESTIEGLLEGLPLSQEERQIAYLIFTADSPENAKATLKEHYGCAHPDLAIDSVTAKLRRARRS
jgi:predicted ArsR family transcriptional regulator